MMAQSIVLVAALLTGVLSYCSGAENVYCVTPTATSCSSCPQNSTHCTTLSEYAREAELYFTSNTTMVFLSGDHVLATDITITNIARLTMRGKSSSDNPPTIVCNGPVGFSFASILDFRIHTLAFTSCSRTYTIPLDDISSFLSLQYTLLYKTGPPSVRLKYALLLQSTQYAELVNCSFHDNLGTALVVNNTNVTLAGNSKFTHNHCEPDCKTGGGGIAAFNSNLTFNGNTTFSENNATLYGAGIFLSTSRLSSTGSIHFINNLNSGLATLQFIPGGTIWAATSSLNFNGTNNFINNSARSDFGEIGGAIYVRDNTSLSFTGVSNFKQNSATNAGAVYAAVNSVLHFGGTSNFSSNYATYGGAILSTQNITLIFDGTASFTNNGHDIRETVASQGGGIFLALTSTISILPNATVYWENNHATLGGAISVWEMKVDGSFDTTYCTQFYTLIPAKRCFFQLPGQNMSNGIDTRLIFKNNSADNAGSVLYGGAVDHCKLTGLDSYNSGAVFDKLVHIEDDNTNSTISSSPFHVCSCENNIPNCGKSHVPYAVYPGETFKVAVVAYGQRGGTVAAAIRSRLEVPFPTLYNNIVKQGGRLQGFQYLQQANNTCTTLNYTVFSQALVSLALYAVGPCSTFGKNLVLDLYINRTCPPGFDLSESASSCVCEQRLAKYTNSCNITNRLGQITRHSNQQFWVGCDNHSNELILHPHCPLDYCVKDTVVFPLNNTDKQCAHNRAGLLCGACKEGYSVVLGTSHCQQCNNNEIAFLILFAIMGLALVFLLLVCKLTVATGVLSGLVFYANIVGVNHNIFLPVESADALSVFIAWLNLDFGIETCFYNGMNAYDKTWLQFVFPVYVGVLVILMIVISHYSPKFANLLGSNPVSVLATLVLLSYTKILRASIDAIHVTYLEYPSYNRRVWLYDASINYLSGQHAALFLIVVIIFLFLSLPYTLLLLLGQFLPAVSHLRLFSWVNRLKPFMDAYHAPYKAKHRYWPGLLLVLRFVLLLVFALNSQQDPSINLLAILAVAGILQLWVLISGGVYTKWYLDALEGSFTLNLIILVGAILYNNNHSEGNRLAAGCTSVSIALVTFIGILIYHIFQQVRHTKLWKKVPKLNLEVNKASIKQTLNAVNPLVHLWEEKPKPNDQEDKREDTSNTNVTHTEVDLCELRSPLDMLDTK